MTYDPKSYKVPTGYQGDNIEDYGFEEEDLEDEE